VARNVRIASSPIPIGADTLIVNKDVPDECTVVGTPGKIVKIDGKKVEQDLISARLF